MLIKGINKKVKIDNVVRLPESIRDKGFCESQALQILLSQFDSGRGLQKLSCFIFLKKVCCDLFLGSSVGRAVDC